MPEIKNLSAGDLTSTPGGLIPAGGSRLVTDGELLAMMAQPAVRGRFDEGKLLVVLEDGPIVAAEPLVDLKAKARALGLKWRGNPTTKTLAERIAALEAK